MEIINEEVVNSEIICPKVMSCYKNNNKYFSKVKDDKNEVHNVFVEIEDDGVKYSCDCCCDFPCMHEYSTIVAIINDEFKEIDLKEFTKEKTFTISDLIQLISGEELKDFLLIDKNIEAISFDENCFKDYFSKYLPKQSYNYYYNNLYNAVILDFDYQKYVKNYLYQVKKYIDKNDYKEALKIIKCIIEVFHDCDKLDYITDELNIISMYLRVIRRKSNEIDWFNYLKNNNYYNNVYLEDMLMRV